MTFCYNREWIGALPGYLYETTWVVAIFTTVIFIYLYRWRKPSYFVQLYLLSMAVKLLAYFTYNLIMIMDDPEGARANVLFFLAVYFLFTAVEIAFLFRRISRS